MTEAIGKARWLVIDTIDPEPLVPFWCALLGVDRAGTFGDNYVLLRHGDGTVPPISFQRVPEPKSGKNRLHLDIHADDLEEAIAMSEQLPGGNTRWEELKVTSDQVVDTVKRLVQEGNVRRIVIKNAEGHTYLEIPLTVGVVGAVLIPLWAALGALAAIASGLTIAIERVENKGDQPPAPPSP